MSEAPPVQGPYVEITPERVCCPGHGEHFRANFPTGFPIFSLHAFQKVTEKPEFWEACCKVAGLAAIHQIPPETMNLVTEHKPICYFLERSEIIEFLTQAGTLDGAAWLRHQRCDLCGIPRLAGPYSIRVEDRPDSPVETKQVCLECACDAGERMHAAYPEGDVWAQQGG